MVLNLAGQTVRTVEMTLRQRVLAFVSDPNVAIILALVGILGLFFDIPPIPASTRRGSWADSASSWPCWASRSCR